MTNLSTNKNSLQLSQRFAIVDILRAYALLGVVVINYTSFHDWDYEHGNNTDLALGLIATYIFFRKSALLLSILFGYGFSVLIDNLIKKGVNTISFFTKRMFWLFVIAFINSCFFAGDILKSYAVLGMLLLLFYKSSTKTILTAAVLMLLLIPFSSGYTLFGVQGSGDTAADTTNLFLSHRVVDVLKYNLTESYIGQVTFPFYGIAVQQIMLCCFLWGMFIQRIHFVENINANKKYIVRMFWFSIPAFALSTWLTYLGKQIPFLKVYYNFFIISFLCAMVFFSAGVMWLFVSGKLKKIFALMQSYGKMTLTNYITQNIIAFFIFSGVGLSIGNSKSYLFYFILAIIIFIGQLFISKFWLCKFNYGPVEWVWRRVISQETLPFKRNLTNG